MLNSLSIHIRVILVILFFEAYLFFSIPEINISYILILCLAPFLIFLSHIFFNIRISRGLDKGKNQKIFLSWLSLFLIFISIAFLTKSSDTLSRVLIVSSIAFSFLFHIFVFSFKNNKKNKVIYVSNNTNSEHYLQRLNKYFNIEMLEIDKLENLNENYADIILINYDHYDKKNMKDLVILSDFYPAPIYLISDKMHTFHFYGIPVYELNQIAITRDPINIFIKNFFDVFFSGVLILALAPILLLIALLIKLESRGPVLYLQERHGLHGKVFKLLKFRSMLFDIDSKFLAAKIDDKRITGVGKIIRRFSLDELPQLINVFIGDMSLVGPRPHAIDMNNKYKKKIEEYMSRHRVKPGITGLAQINGYRGGDDIDSIKKRTKYDLQYIRKWSLANDLVILLKTVPAVFDKNAY